MQIQGRKSYRNDYGAFRNNKVCVSGISKIWRQASRQKNFQAIRIEVNSELEGLEEAIRDFVDVLAPGGRLAVITFHSLEDRIVKNTFASLAKGCDCPKDFPVCVCGKKPQVKNVTGKPVVADEEELERNFRAHSAKLRVIEKL